MEIQLIKSGYNGKKNCRQIENKWEKFTVENQTNVLKGWRKSDIWKYINTCQWVSQWLQFKHNYFIYELHSYNYYFQWNIKALIDVTASERVFSYLNMFWAKL